MSKPVKYILIGVFIVLCSSVNVLNAEYYGDVAQFVAANPDGNKYDFVKTYIMSLTYIKSNEERELDEIILDADTIENMESIGSLMDGLTLDSVNWRVARNLLKRYYDPSNGLMLKVTDLFQKMSEEQIDLNSKERFLLGELNEAQISGKMNSFDAHKFFKENSEITVQRKESFKKLLESALLVTKVLISSQENEYGELEALGINDRQRDRLIYRLDEFYGDEYEGPAREGQSFLQASISELKEFLADYSWKTLDEDY